MCVNEWRHTAVACGVGPSRRVVSQTSTINVEDTSLNIDAIEVKIDDDDEEKTRDVNFTIAMRARDIPRAGARGWGKLPNGSEPCARAKSARGGGPIVRYRHRCLPLCTCPNTAHSMMSVSVMTSNGVSMAYLPTTYTRCFVSL